MEHKISYVGQGNEDKILFVGQLSYGKIWKNFGK